MKVRVRFGMTLGWPIKNAAIFVFYVKEDVWVKLREGVDTIRPFLPSDISSRLVCQGEIQLP